MSLPSSNYTGSATSGLSAYERLTETQVDAMARTLWDFAWNPDPNDPDFGKHEWKDAGKPAHRNYRQWARAIFLAAETGQPVHAWFDDRVREQT